MLSHFKPRHILIHKIDIDKNINQIDINKYFFSVIIFVLSLFSITILLTISDINFGEAFKLGILTLMNTVNSSMYSVADINFVNLTIQAKVILITFMIIGRVELITLLIIGKKFLFKN